MEKSTINKIAGKLIVFGFLLLVYTWLIEKSLLSSLDRVYLAGVNHAPNGTEIGFDLSSSYIFLGLVIVIGIILLFYSKNKK